VIEGDDLHHAGRIGSLLPGRRFDVAAPALHHLVVSSDIDLDHVAVATERQADAWPRYAGDLAGAWVSGGESIGFHAAQVSYANGMKVEVLEPHLVEQNDFLRRFLDANGPGAHHLTFKVRDIRASLRAAEAAGLSPVGVDLRDPQWQEAFLHPKQAHGVVVQLAQSQGTWESPPPPDLPTPATDAPATLDHVTHVVASLEEAATLFRDLLGGAEVGAGALDGGRFLDLAWPGGGRVRLVAAVADDGGTSPWTAWLEGRPGRVHHLAFTVPDPAEVPDAVPADDGSWEVAPERNLGVRLVLRGA
jgi:methylmalonyl-CoA/ethylmalonyl-CoA epimerase